MSAFSRLKSFLRGSLLRTSTEREMDDEMQFHVDARMADLQAQGLPRSEAMQRARSEFGSLVAWKDDARDARGLRFLDDLRADLRFAVRMMRRAPAFTLAAVGSLALGIGASAAIFGLLDALLFKGLPVKNPDQLVHVMPVGQNGPAHSGLSNYPWYRDVLSRRELFSDAMLVRHDVYKVGIQQQVEALTGQQVTANYHNLLGVPAFLGRTLVAADQSENATAAVAVISHRLWQRRFAEDPHVLGFVITVDQRPYTIVGVTPPAFDGMLVGWTTDVTVPLDVSGYGDPANWRTLSLIARMRPGVDPAEAGVQLSPMLQRMAASHVSNRFRQRYLQSVVVERASSGIGDLRAEFSWPLRLLMAAVSLLLLIACVNLAGLLVARNTTRRHELATRSAIGAGLSRIMRQLVAESAVLSICGAALGLLFATKLANLLLTFLPPYFGPLSISVTIDGRLVGFAIAATAATTVLFGVMPAWRAGRHAIWGKVTASGTRTTTPSARLGRSLVVLQFALALVLAAGAALLWRTLVNYSRVDAGFDRGHALIVQIDPQGTRYQGDELRAFQRDVLAALNELPGIEHSTIATSSPFNGNIDGKRLTVPGVVPRDADDGGVQANLVGAEYFETFNIPILRGRPIDDRDQAGSVRVAVVSERFAKRYFTDAGHAIGKQFVTGGGETAVTHTIVGVARDVRYQDLRAASEQLVYLPWFQAADVDSMPFEFIVRTVGNPEDATTVVRAAIQRARFDAPILGIHSMTRVINRRLLSERLLAVLAGFFALFALALAAVGAYGLLAQAVAQRLREMGIRLALGAQSGGLAWMILRENLLLAVLGCTLGVGIAVGGLQVLEGLLFGLSPTDPTTLGGTAAVVVLIAFAVAVAPAYRASSVNPVDALKLW